MYIYFSPLFPYSPSYGPLEFFSRNRPSRPFSTATFNETKNKYRRNIPRSNAGEQVVQIDGIGRRPPANYPRRLTRSRGTLHGTRECTHDARPSVSRFPGTGSVKRHRTTEPTCKKPGVKKPLAHLSRRENRESLYAQTSQGT